MKVGLAGTEAEERLVTNPPAVEEASIGEDCEAGS
jgi:hypothetical protein